MNWVEVSAGSPFSYIIFIIQSVYDLHADFTSFLFTPIHCRLLPAIDGGEKERFEAYRELGTALHTLEDFLAHCERHLLKFIMGLELIQLLSLVC